MIYIIRFNTNNCDGVFGAARCYSAIIEGSHMNTKRDEFLTEAMGEHYWDHECDEADCSCHEDRMDFSTWPDFGKLWEWAQGQEWWGVFGDDIVYGESEIAHEKHQCRISDLEYFIHPDRFANALYEFLKEIP